MPALHPPLTQPVQQRLPAPSCHPIRRSAGAAALVCIALAALPLAMAVTMQLGLPPAAQAQSNLLQKVRRDPARARALCNQLRQMNQQGISATSRQATRTIADQEGLSPVDAEVLITYVMGMHCTDVR